MDRLQAEGEENVHVYKQMEFQVHNIKKWWHEFTLIFGPIICDGSVDNIDNIDYKIENAQQKYLTFQFQGSAKQNIIDL